MKTVQVTINVNITKNNAGNSKKWIFPLITFPQKNKEKKDKHKHNHASTNANKTVSTYSKDGDSSSDENPVTVVTIC